MAKSVTNVMSKVKSFLDENEAKALRGWQGVLADIQADIENLKRLVPIVEKKIRKGEPWPGDSATQT